MTKTKNQRNKNRKWKSTIARRVNTSTTVLLTSLVKRDRINAKEKGEEMRGKFGWDLPPGVTNRMIEEQAGAFEEEEMSKKLVCPHCGNSNFNEKILQEIFVPYIWDETTGEYKEQKDELGDAESEGLYCRNCKRDTNFVWLDMCIGEIK